MKEIRFLQFYSARMNMNLQITKNMNLKKMKYENMKIQIATNLNNGILYNEHLEDQLSRLSSEISRRNKKNKLLKLWR